MNPKPNRKLASGALDALFRCHPVMEVPENQTSVIIIIYSTSKAVSGTI